MENKQLSRLLAEICDELCDYLPDDLITGMSEKHEQLLNRVVGAIKWLDGDCCRDFEDFMGEYKLQFVSAPVGDGSLFAEVDSKVVDVSWAKTGLTHEDNHSHLAPTMNDFNS
ncbi:hypothetical protein [Endozoicomonas sp. 4G]|uniref:hypothetical protein n=1 Tax=Endozoicomonas sp. 4G TaxID=2872754 RepID=UPI002078B155|nr:hypothetical protein [Endozoicomonas sp. 4G]